MNIASKATIRRNRAGFTLIEALVAAALLATGVAATLGAFGALNHTEASAREVETMQRLAFQKYDELLATSTDLTAPQDGDFSDQNLSGYTWKSEEEPSGVENLDAVTVTVQKANDNSSNPLSAVAYGLVYVPPTTTDSGATQ